MEVHVFETKEQMGEHAAADGAAFVRQAIADRGHANIIVATGASQFEMLAALVQEPDIDWSKVTGFHLDEYLGLPITHEASFRKYLKEEPLACAKKLGALPGFNLLCIDTENKFISTGLAKDIANAAQGKYHQIAKADGNAIASVTNQALNELKAQ